ncbi:hypothetical protein VIGAN_03070700 [Vigna angularis var. angularis]|uniref:Uncharacterized protein n=1 Tax=Vigna angularis var. angularis TaxID=157739 RepID=A0A0S3RKK4_PHAAN|nr:hypothetical protein VIGAN_03070700 [Vigna angularis var. angularis]
MNEAAILTARRDLKEISKDEISDALERIIAGLEKKNAVAGRIWKGFLAEDLMSDLEGTDIYFWTFFTSDLGGPTFKEGFDV